MDDNISTSMDPEPSAVLTPEASPAPAPELVPAPTPAPQPANDAAAEALVASWVNTYVSDSPISRSVEAVNYMTQVAVPALVKLLSAKGI